MYARPHKNRKGEDRFHPVFEDRESPLDFDNVGFCLGCGSETSGVEPDACKYPCESCGQPLVYGLEEIAIMGLVEIEGGEDE